MAETLGSLCDKLTIVKLKQWHSEDKDRLNSLAQQETQLTEEIDEFVRLATQGQIPPEKLTFQSNKVFKAEGNEISDIKGDIGSLFAQLAQVNCDLWHEQEKVYEFEKVAAEEKDKVVKKLAILNLERNKCMNEIDNRFLLQVSQKKG
jgi:ribosomal protein L44E